MFAKVKNPAKNEFVINYTLPVNSNVKIGIYSMEGVLIKSYIEKDRSGNNQFKINTNADYIPSGSYVVRVSTDNYNKSLLLNITK